MLMQSLRHLFSYQLLKLNGSGMIAHKAHFTLVVWGFTPQGLGTSKDTFCWDGESCGRAGAA